MLRAGEIAAASLPKAQVINLLQVPGGSESQQVMLQVRFAEVNRRMLSGGRLSAVRRPPAASSARSTTQQFAAPDFDDGEDGGLVFSDFLNLFFFDRKQGIGGVIKALESTRRVPEPGRAEPDRLQRPGSQLPRRRRVPGAGRAGRAPAAVSVIFKEFGIRLTFTPTIAGDAIRLKVRPEVSSLDFANGVTLSGFRIPALTTRRAETDVELRDGQSFAIAGLLDNISQNDSRGDSDPEQAADHRHAVQEPSAKRAEQTELMVLITPRLVRRARPGRSAAAADADRAVHPQARSGGRAAAGRPRQPARGRRGPGRRAVGAGAAEGIAEVVISLRERGHSCR